MDEITVKIKTNNATLLNLLDRVKEASVNSDVKEKFTNAFKHSADMFYLKHKPEKRVANSLEFEIEFIPTDKLIEFVESVDHLRDATKMVGEA